MGNARASIWRKSNKYGSHAFFITKCQWGESGGNKGKMTGDILSLDNAAENFTAIIKKLAQEGNLASLTINITGAGSDELLKLANQLGVKETIIIAHSYNNQRL